MTPDNWKDRYLSRFDTHHFNNTVMDFCNTLMLEDIWRVKNPGVLQYSWFNPDQTCKSRIDYWFLAYGLWQHVSDISMDFAPLTDHSLIHLELKLNINSKRNRGFWKFNSDLLKDEEYRRNIRAMVDESINDPEIQSYANKWEFFKYNVRKNSISYSKEKDLKGEFPFFDTWPLFIGINLLLTQTILVQLGVLRMLFRSIRYLRIHMIVAHRATAMQPLNKTLSAAKIVHFTYILSWIANVITMSAQIPCYGHLGLFSVV